MKITLPREITLEAAERRLILHALVHTHGDTTAAAKLLHVGRGTLELMTRRHRIFGGLQSLRVRLGRMQKKGERA